MVIDLKNLDMAGFANLSGLKLSDEQIESIENLAPRHTNKLKVQAMIRGKFGITIREFINYSSTM